MFSGVKGRIDGKKASEITRELLLSGVSVTDNGQPFDINSVEVQIPSLQDGENAVRLVARDASGNQNVATVMVYCDKKAPVIVKNATAANVLELNQAVPGREELLKRIQVQDASPYDVTYTLSNEEWGYKIEYTVTDAYGNVSSYTDRIQYLEYTITGSSMLTVADITQTESLKAGLSFKDSKGRTLALPSDMRVVTEPINDLYYRVVYYYQYRGPLGTRNAVFERIISVGE